MNKLKPLCVGKITNLNERIVVNKGLNNLIIIETNLGTFTNMVKNIDCDRLTLAVEEIKTQDKELCYLIISNSSNHKIIKKIPIKDNKKLEIKEVTVSSIK